jgi:transposase
MNWPALSPDLNPIEHLWDEIQRWLNEEQSSLTTAAELSISFQRVWAGIPIAFILKYNKHNINLFYIV